jgi:predicted RND superfamily exporter protein
MWHKVARLILTYRLPILVVLALITIGMGSQLNKLKLSYGYANLLPPEDPANLEFLEFKELFDDDGMVMVVGADDARLFELENFQKWYNLGQDIKEVSVARPEILEGAALDTRFPFLDLLTSRKILPLRNLTSSYWLNKRLNLRRSSTH